MMSKYHRPRLTPKHQDSQHLLFSVFTANDIRNLSVTKIRTPLCYNILGHPLKGGLYDPSLGKILILFYFYERYFIHTISRYISLFETIFLMYV